MTPDRARLEELFHAALDLPPSSRRAFLERACGGDGDLLREVLSLVDAATDSADFLEAPAHRSFGDLDPSLEGKRFGRFRIVRRIASGGMGTVFEAEQDEPRRTIALKLLRPGAAGKKALERFRMEAEVLGRLRHPGVAQVYEAGVSELEQAAPWIAMEYVPGARHLLDFVRERAFTVEQRVRLFLDVCAAVHHGHQKGVIHRDLKPSNVLVDEDGRVKVIDFGVARVVDEERQAMLTGHGELVGTLQYMSPEQCAGDPDRVDVRTDVHALGLLLYEAVCGRRPYDIAGLPLTEAVQAVVRREPLRPTRARTDVPRDLEAVLLKALEKEPDRRYSSVAELAEDLRRFLRHEPVVARPPRPLHALALFARRRPAVVLGALALVVSAAASAGFAVATRRAQVRAEADAATLGQMLEFVLDLFGRARPSVAQGDEPRVSELFDGALERIDQRLAGQPRAQIQLLWSIAMTQQEVGRAEESLPYLQRLYEISEEIGFFQDGVQEARLLRHRARALQHAGDAEGARADYERAGALFWDHAGERDPKRIACLVDHAGFLVTRGELDAASALLEEAIRLDGGRGVEFALALANLGLVLFKRGEFAKAEPKLRDALARLDAEQDGPSLEAARVMNALGLVLKMQGKRDEARTLYERSLEIHHRLVPDDDQGLMTIELNLGALFQQEDELDAAEDLLARAEERARRLGDGGLLLHVHRQAMVVASKRERWDEVARRAREALALLQPAGDPNRTDSAEFRFQLGVALLELRRPEEAAPHLEAALAAFERAPELADAAARARALLDLARTRIADR